METKIMKFLMNKKTLFISVLVFMALTFLIPIQKPGFNIPHNYTAFFQFLSNYGEYIILAVILIMTIVICMNEKADKFLSNMFNFKWIYISSYAVEIVFMILWISRIPGLWWSWSTIGSFVLTILVTPVILKDKVSKIDALLLGAGATSLIAGVWETIYKYGLWKYYEKSQGMPFHNYFVTIEFMFPFIVVGVIIIGLIVLKDSKALMAQFKSGANIKLSTLILAVTVVMLVIWFASGFWTDGYTNISNDTWVVTKQIDWAMDLYRATKVTSNLTFLAVIGFWNFKRINK
jgi:hypothetical protein